MLTIKWPFRKEEEGIDEQFLGQSLSVQSLLEELPGFEPKTSHSKLVALPSEQQIYVVFTNLCKINAI
jgi:hypothetical protein